MSCHKRQFNETLYLPLCSTDDSSENVYEILIRRVVLTPNRKQVLDGPWIGPIKTNYNCGNQNSKHKKILSKTQSWAFKKCLKPHKVKFLLHCTPESFERSCTWTNMIYVSDDACAIMPNSSDYFVSISVPTLEISLISLGIFIGLLLLVSLLYRLVLRAYL